MYKNPLSLLQQYGKNRLDIIIDFRSTRSYLQSETKLNSLARLVGKWQEEMCWNVMNCLLKITHVFELPGRSFFNTEMKFSDEIDKIHQKLLEWILQVVCPQVQAKQ